MTGHILLGYEPTAAGERALAWAVDEARLRGLALAVGPVLHRPSPSRPEGASGEPADAAVHRAGEAAAGVRVTAAPGRLVDAAPTAALIVLGRPAPDALTGSEVEHLLGTAGTAPVIVVPPDSAATGDRIVVGVDGSPASRTALELAFTEAGLRAAAVTAVCGWWSVPGPGREGRPFTEDDRERRIAETRFAEEIAPWAARRPKVAVDRVFVTEPPQDALLRRSAGAVLLVLGDHGLGTAPAERFGPVTRTVLAAATCPVAVTRAPHPH